jgi:hypothetical protein
MKRRAVLVSMGVGLLGQLPLAPAPGAEAAPPVTTHAAARAYDPFKKIARDKGVQIFIDKTQPKAMATEAALHLDMNMVHASIEHAIELTRGNALLNAKFQRLLQQGTPVQQVEFVMGSGRYYFPEDLETAVAEQSTASSNPQCWVCETVCPIVCSCQGNGDQYCREHCRQVCHKYC